MPLNRATPAGHQSTVTSKVDTPGSKSRSEGPSPRCQSYPTQKSNSSSEGAVTLTCSSGGGCPHRRIEWNGERNKGTPQAQHASSALNGGGQTAPNHFSEKVTSGRLPRYPCHAQRLAGGGAGASSAGGPGSLRSRRTKSSMDTVYVPREVSYLTHDIVG